MSENSPAFESASAVIDTIMGTIMAPNHQDTILAFLGPQAQKEVADYTQVARVLTRFIASDMLLGMLRNANDAPIVHLSGMVIADSYDRDAFDLGIPIGEPSHTELVKYISLAMRQHHAALKSVH